MRSLHHWQRLLGLAPSRQLQRSSSTAMRAWQSFQYGGTDQLQQSSNVKIPTITRPDQVLVKVHAASVNPIDAAMLGGYGASTINSLRNLTCSRSQPEFPLVLGRDFSGVVVDTGQELGKRSFKNGDEVWGVVSPLSYSQGSLADYVVVSCQHCGKKPRNLSHVEAASFPYVTCTAWSAIVTFGQLNYSNCYGKKMLILGGGGGLGTFSIQLLKAWGAHVTTTTDSESLEKTLELGANISIDYKNPDLMTELKKLPKFHFILDGVYGNPVPTEAWLDLLRPDVFAHYVTLNSPLLKNNDEMGVIPGFIRSTAEVLYQSAMHASQVKQVRWAFFIPSSAALDRTAKLIEDGKVKPVVEKVYTFDQFPEALEQVSKRSGRGKTIIDVKGDLEHEEQELTERL